MYLLAFSILLLCSALNLKAQDSYGELMLPDTGVAQKTLFLEPGSQALIESGEGRVDGATWSERNKPLLSEEEGIFFEAMCSALEYVDCQVMAKVNLDDVISTVKLSRAMRGKLEKARAKLDRKHVDFVVCWGNTLDVLVIARIDPAPGLRPLQKLMQRRIDEVLDSIGIPVVLFPPAEVYDEDQILSALTPHLI